VHACRSTHDSALPPCPANMHSDRAANSCREMTAARASTTSSLVDGMARGSAVFKVPSERISAAGQGQSTRSVPKMNAADERCAAVELHSRSASIMATVYCRRRGGFTYASSECPGKAWTCRALVAPRIQTQEGWNCHASVTGCGLSSVPKPWNESRTNRARIADSIPIRNSFTAISGGTARAHHKIL
jgi:hypothetical protein